MELQFDALRGALVRSSIVFCNSVPADRSGMAAPRFLPTAAACVILVRFAVETRTSHCNGNVRRVNGALAAGFSDFDKDDFPFKSSCFPCVRAVCKCISV